MSALCPGTPFPYLRSEELYIFEDYRQNQKEERVYSREREKTNEYDERKN